MQADYWDSTILLGDPVDGITAAAAPDPSDLSRRISHAILFPQGRVGGWLVFVTGLCALVVLHATRVLLP